MSNAVKPGHSHVQLYCKSCDIIFIAFEDCYAHLREHGIQKGDEFTVQGLMHLCGGKFHVKQDLWTFRNGVQIILTSSGEK